MKAVLFDLDGTLLDTLLDLADATNHALCQMGFPPRSVEEIRSFVGNGMENLLRKALPEDQKDAVNEIFPVFREYYGIHSEDKTCPYEGVLPLLDRLKKEGYAIGVVSNKLDFAVQTLVKKYFPSATFAVGEREGIRRKPSPDSVEEAIRRLASEKNETLYVGDSEVDVATAKAAGIPCVAVTWGFRDREELVAAGAEHLAATPDELYTLIRQLI